MEDKNKIDIFFSNTFDELSSQEPDWLTPPERVWEAASEHFPKKKKKRRILLWLFFGLMTISSLGVFLGIESGTETTIKQNSNLGTNPSSVIKEEVQQERNSLTINKEQLINNKATPLSKKENQSETVNLKQEISKKVESKSKKEILERHLKNSTVREPSTKHSIGVNATTSKNLIAGAHTNLASENTSSANEKVEKKQSSDVENADKSSDLRLALSEMPSLQTVEIKSINNTELNPSLATLPITITPSIHRKEYGLTYRYIGVNLTDIIELEEGSMDEINSTNEYRNVNLDYRKWLNKKWSIQSGLWFTRLSSEIDFSIFSQLDRDAKEFLAQELVGFSVRDEEKNINSLVNLRFKDNNTLEIGDVVNYRSNVGTDLYVLQLPFMIDRHYDWNSWEFLLGGGFTFDFLYARQGAHELEIYKSGNLINEPFYFEDISQVAVDFSIYTNMGARYKITPKFNIGLTTRIMMTDPIYSGIEAGIYYRL